MSYEVRNAPLSARFGTGFAQGLSEQIPKEIERYRLASGLKNFAQNAGNMDPMQQMAELSGIYGITPQMIQSFGELAKQQGIRNAYSKNRSPNENQQGNPKAAQPNLDVKEFLMNQMANQKQMQGQPKNNNLSRQSNPPTIPSNMSRQQEALSSPPAASENPLSPQFLPASPWNQQRQEGAINEAFDRGIARTFDEANNYANQQRQLYEQAPEKYREQLDYKEGIDKKVDGLFDTELQTRLQKEGNDTFNDIPGDLQLNIKKQARNSVATGNMNPKQAAEFYSKKALDLVKDRNRVLEIANRDISDKIFPHKKEESLKNLKHISKRFADMGSSEYLYKLLRSEMDLSPGGAATIAYDQSERVKDLIKTAKISANNSAQGTRQFAQKLFKSMSPEDSFLSIAKQMKQSNPSFNERAFFDYLRENTDQYSSNDRLNREVSQGVSDFFPNWGDIFLFTHPLQVGAK